MKILHVGKYFPPFRGGMETFQRDLMSAQLRQGLAPSGLVHSSERRWRSVRQDYPTRDGTLPLWRAAVWLTLVFTPISPGFGLLLRQLLRREQPDVLHLHLPNVSAFWALLLPRARRIPWVVQWQTDVIPSEHSLGLRLLYPLYRPFERALLKRACRIIVSSPPYLESSPTLGEFRDKCRVIPLGLDPDMLPAAPRSAPPGAVTGELRVLAIGRLTYYKGFQYLLQAAAELPGLQLRLVGSGEEERSLRKLAGELGLGSRVRFLGRLDDAELAAEFAAADCLSLPSIERTESFGLVLLEAMHHGLATVVATPAGSGVGWVVEHGLTGLCVAPQDSGALAAALRQLADDHAMLRSLGASGKCKFDGQFHIERCAEHILALYREILTDRASSGGHH